MIHTFGSYFFFLDLKKVKSTFLREIIILRKRIAFFKVKSLLIKINVEIKKKKREKEKNTIKKRTFILNVQGHIPIKLPFFF